MCAMLWHRQMGRERKVAMGRSKVIRNAVGAVVALRCLGCGKEKPLQDYHNDSYNSVHGKQSTCKECSILKLRGVVRTRSEGFKRFSFSLSPAYAEMFRAHAEREKTKTWMLLREWVIAILEGRMWYNE